VARPAAERDAGLRDAPANAPTRSESSATSATPIIPPFPEVAAAEREFRQPRAEAAPIATRVRTPEWQGDLAPSPRRPTLAEQAVPWLIGVILLLAGMIIVLMALIFSSDGGFLGGGRATTSPSASATLPGIVPLTSPGASGGVATGSGTPLPSGSPAPSATPGPVYGALEMFYRARATAADPIYLYRVDFTTVDAAVAWAQASEGIERYAWAPDGTQGAVIVDRRLIAITNPDVETRLLAEGIDAITFGRDAATIYAVSITAGDPDDTARVLAIGYASGEIRQLGSVTYPHPPVPTMDTLRSAQFADDGGPVRMRWNADGRLVLEVQGAPTYVFDPSGGEPRQISTATGLLSPDGGRYVAITDDGSSTELTLRTADGGARVAKTTAPGLVSHLRWAPNGSQVVFTLSRPNGAGGVLQDLYLWNLDDAGPIQLTSNGASFGAEFLGSPEVWHR
jgi:hypothetical protein